MVFVTEQDMVAYTLEGFKAFATAVVGGRKRIVTAYPNANRSAVVLYAFSKQVMVRHERKYQ